MDMRNVDFRIKVPACLPAELIVIVSACYRDYAGQQEDCSNSQLDQVIELAALKALLGEGCTGSQLHQVGNRWSGSYFDVTSPTAR